MLFAQRNNNTSAIMFRTAMRNAEARRKAVTAYKLDLYGNAITAAVLDQIRRVYKQPERITPVSVNILRKIINRLACVYLQDATRSIDGTEQERAIFSGIEDSAALPVQMKMANRLCKLTGNVLLRPVWRNNAMRLDLLTGDILDVQTGDSPEDLLSVLVTHHPANGKADEISYSLWTAEEYQRLSYSGTVLESEPNPYGRLPFVPIWNMPPTSEFWLPGAEDLILLQDAVNERLTDLCYVLKFQSFGVGYVKGTKIKAAKHDSLESGPGSVFLLPEGADLGFAAPDAPVEACLEAIDKLMKWAAVSNGLPASSMTLEPSEESGLSKIVANSELAEARRDDIAMFAKVEEQLFQLMRVIWNAHNPARQIREAATLTVDFYDPKPSMTATEQLKEWQGMMELGLISPVDVLLEKNPDLTRDAAKARLLQIRDEIKEFQDISFAYPA